MSDGIQIERSKHAQEFVIIGNAEARDRRLSFRARGLHHHLLSLPPGWRVTTAQLAEDHPEGRTAIRAALSELVTLGYVTRRKQQDGRGRWTTTMTVHDKPQVSAGDTEDRIPVVGNPVVGEPGVGEPVPVLKTEPKTVNEDDEKSMAAQPEAAPVAGGPAMVSRRGRATAQPRVLTNQDKIDGTRFAIAEIYGESWNKTISDEEALALFTMKAPTRKPVTSVVAYMRKIFEDTPAFDTLLSQLDTEQWAEENLSDDEQPYPPCPRCGGMRAEIDPQRGVCAWCARELIIAAPAEPEGWNVTILQAVNTALYITTGKSMDNAWCSRVAEHILTDDKGKPRDIKGGVAAKVKYITTTISNDPNPGRFLPTPQPTGYAA